MYCTLAAVWMKSLSAPEKTKMTARATRATTSAVSVGLAAGAAGLIVEATCTVISLGGEQFRGDEAIDVRVRLGDALRFGLGADRKAFGVDELDVGHPKEAEEVAHVAGLRILGRAGIEPSARGEHVDLLSAEQPDRSLVRV